MSLPYIASENVIDRIKKLDYPYPVYNTTLHNIELLTIIKNSEHTTIQPITNYATLTHIKRPSKKLGFAVIDLNELKLCNEFTARYTLSERVKSKRHDVELSPYEYWQRDKDRIIKLGLDEVNGIAKKYARGDEYLDVVEQCADILYRTGMPSSFQSNLVVRVLTHFGIKPNQRMLDISAGWGDRLIACCAMGIHYTACDPNTKLAPLYEKIITELKSEMNINTELNVHTVPFEDWQPDPKEFNTYDVLFTSPPFFNLEIYCDEPTQSINRHKTVYQWVNNFMKPSLFKTSQLLKTGGLAILHLSDVINFKDRSKSLYFVDEIITYCVDVLKWTYLGEMAYGIRDTNKVEITQEELDEKRNRERFIKRTVFKDFKDGLRINQRGQYLAQLLWCFRK